MLMPKTCPICGSPVMNKFKETYDKNGFALEKTCDKKLDHILFCSSKRADENEVYVLSLTLRTEDEFSVSWYPREGLVWVANNKITGRVKLPYFEPDFSNLRKLIKKIKTYMVFS